MGERERDEMDRVALYMAKPNAVFVFGSNLAGRHGAGAALTALRQYGAQYGRGSGIQGRSYAIPTKDANLNTLSVEAVAYGVRAFLSFAQDHPELTFVVTRIGCGLAGFTDDDIAPLFAAAPDNCKLPAGWRAPLPAEQEPGK